MNEDPGISDADRRDEAASAAIEARFEQARTNSEVRRTYRFLLARLEKLNRSHNRRTANRAAEAEPLTEEQRFARTVKTRFGLTKGEALNLIGCRTYPEFVSRERAKAAPEAGKEFDPLRQALNLIIDYYEE